MKDTSSYKAQLEEEKTRLETSLGTVAEQNPANPGDWVPAAADVAESDPSLKADHMQRFSENVAIAEDLEVRYADVKDALAKMENGTYGVCETSGEQIEEERLDADPAARTCVAHIA